MTATTDEYIKERYRYAKWIGEPDVPPCAVLVVSKVAFRQLLNDGEIKYDRITHTIGRNPAIVCRGTAAPFYFLPPKRNNGRILFVGGPYDHKLIDLTNWPESLSTLHGGMSHSYRLTMHQTERGTIYVTYEYCGSVGL